MDRIDLHVEVPRLAPGLLLEKGARGECSSTIRERVVQCRSIQLERQHCPNSRLGADHLLEVCQLGRPQRQSMEAAARQLQLSGRALHRTLRVARTIADLDREPAVGGSHLSEALAYRGAL